MHQALAQRANTMGLVLIEAMHYEIRLAGSAELLPPTWNDMLTPGTEVLLNARVPSRTDNQVICPTCSTTIAISDTHSQGSATWISWSVQFAADIEKADPSLQPPLPDASLSLQFRNTRHEPATTRSNRVPLAECRSRHRHLLRLDFAFVIVCASFQPRICAQAVQKSSSHCSTVVGVSDSLQHLPDLTCLIP